ncbi:MAG: type II toxin-antitoxin system VapC family toxin [Capsulimonadaceae bacterium]
MRYLLDTHALLWAARGADELPQAVGDAIIDASNDIFVSIASFWEIAIKASLGKLPLTGTVAALQSRTEAMNITTLPLSAMYLDVLRGLPYHHRDPFDRIIISTAIEEGLSLISMDTEFPPYNVPLWWG